MFCQCLKGKERNLNYKIMSKKQRENMNLLFQELKEEYYV